MGHRPVHSSPAPRELHTLHILSSKYHLGPKVYGTFENGRLEEFFESTTLSSSDMRDSTISAWIGARMAELHSVDIEVVEETLPESRGEGKGLGPQCKVNVKSWLPLAQAVLALPNVPEALRNEIDLEKFSKEWKAYLKMVVSGRRCQEWQSASLCSQRRPSTGIFLD